jgi:hypothetical protein
MVDVYEEDFTVRHHDHDPRFDRETPDTEWLRALGGDGDPCWVVLSGDGRILTNRVERQVLREVNLTFFCMTKTWTHMLIHEYVWKFLKVWPHIVADARASIGTPALFEVGGGRALKVRRIGRTKGPD